MHWWTIWDEKSFFKGHPSLLGISSKMLCWNIYMQIAIFFFSLITSGRMWKLWHAVLCLQTLYFILISSRSQAWILGRVRRRHSRKIECPNSHVERGWRVEDKIFYVVCSVLLGPMSSIKISLRPDFFLSVTFHFHVTSSCYKTTEALADVPIQLILNYRWNLEAMEAFKANLRLFSSFGKFADFNFDLNYHSSPVNLLGFAMGRDEKFLRFVTLTSHNFIRHLTNVCVKNSCAVFQLKFLLGLDEGHVGKRWLG